MWRLFVAVLLLATPVWAQENATAYEALRVVGTQYGRGALNHIVLITGVKGEPQPFSEDSLRLRPQHSFDELRIALGREPEVEPGAGQTVPIPAVINGRVKDANGNVIHM